MHNTSSVKDQQEIDKYMSNCNRTRKRVSHINPMQHTMRESCDVTSVKQEQTPRLSIHFSPKDIAYKYPDT